MTELTFRERAASGEPERLLVLHHGRGADENDLLGLADALDPERRFHVVTPRAPLELPGWPGYHWYVVPRVGFPDPATFHASVAALAGLHDELWRRTGVPPERTVFGGFSMGSVMSYSLGLDPGRPQPAGLLVFSGFIPTLEDWRPDLTRSDMPVFVTHGRQDRVIPVEFARTARATLEDAGFSVDYHETDAGHFIEPTGLEAAREWLSLL